MFCTFAAAPARHHAHTRFPSLSYKAFAPGVAGSCFVAHARKQDETERQQADEL